MPQLLRGAFSEHALPAAAPFSVRYWEGKRILR